MIGHFSSKPGKCEEHTPRIMNDPLKGKVAKELFQNANKMLDKIIKNKLFRLMLHMASGQLILRKMTSYFIKMRKEIAK